MCLKCDDYYNVVCSGTGQFRALQQQFRRSREAEHSAKNWQGDRTAFQIVLSHFLTNDQPAFMTCPTLLQGTEFSIATQHLR